MSKIGKGEGPGDPRKGIPALGNMYRAFDDYESGNRQRKYLIEELEDTIENLKKELVKCKELNKNLEANCDKLTVGANNAEIRYEKTTKEKALMEHESDKISKEMDEITGEISRKKEKIEKMKILRAEKLEMCRQKYAQYLQEYMKNPQIANIMEKAKKAEELEATVKEKNAVLAEQMQLVENLKIQYGDEWDNFKKNCIKAAELHGTIKDKLTKMELLQLDASSPNLTEARQVATSPKPIPIKASGPLPNTPFRMDNLGSKVGAAVLPQRRSSTFEQLNRLLGKSNKILKPSSPYNNAAMASGNGGIGNAARKNLCSPKPGASTSSLVSQIRSKLKGTVHPMPRSHEPPNNIPVAQQAPKDSNPPPAPSIHRGSINMSFNEKENLSTVEVQPATKRANMDHHLRSIQGRVVASTDDEHFVRPLPPPPIQQNTSYSDSQINLNDRVMQSTASASVRNNVEKSFFANDVTDRAPASETPSPMESQESNNSTQPFTPSVSGLQPLAEPGFNFSFGLTPMPSAGPSNNNDFFHNFFGGGTAESQASSGKSSSDFFMF